MSQIWETIAARQTNYTPDQFEVAAYRLVVEQVLYYADRNSRTSYWIVEQYERDFKNVLAPLGITVNVNRQRRYAFAMPRHEKMGSATVDQTKLALVLRAIYDEHARIGELSDDYEVFCDLVELEEKYRLMIGRDLPTKGEFETLLRTMKRWGIARKSDEVSADSINVGTTDYSSVIIRPAITDLLGEVALQRLSRWHEHSVASDEDSRANNVDNGETDNETP